MVLVKAALENHRVMKHVLDLSQLPYTQGGGGALLFNANIDIFFLLQQFAHDFMFSVQLNTIKVVRIFMMVQQNSLWSSPCGKADTI